MRGYRHWGVLLLQLQLACAAPVAVRPAHLRAGVARSGETKIPRVVVLESSASALLERTVQGFLAGFDGDVIVYTNAGAADPERLAEAVRQSQPELIFALGRQALIVANKYFPTTPTLFAAVMNYRRYNLDKSPQNMGISLETPVTAEFLQFKMVTPNVTNVLVFYSPPSSKVLVDLARQELTEMNIHLKAVPVRGLDEIKTAFATGAFGDVGIDAIWMANDPAIVNVQTFEYLRDQSIERNVPLFTSLSDRFAYSGALASVGVDFSAIGSQAAAMARRVLEGGLRPVDIGVESPIGTQLVVNADVADAIGFVIPESSLPFISRIIRQATTPVIAGAPGTPQ